eukprot:7375812-Prymnesium_polylepis.2
MIDNETRMEMMPHRRKGGNLHHQRGEDNEPLKTLCEHPRRPEEDAANVDLANRGAACISRVIRGARDASELCERKEGHDRHGDIKQVVDSEALEHLVAVILSDVHVTAVTSSTLAKARHVEEGVGEWVVQH